MRLKGWRLLLFARCRDATQIASDELDGEVSTDRRWAARLHTLACGPCRRGLKQMRWLERKLAEAPPEVLEQIAASIEPARLTPEAAERIRRSLADARAADEN